MGAGGRGRRPMSFFSTDVENPKRAHMVGCVTHMLLILGCVLTFGSISVLINGFIRGLSGLQYGGIAMASVGIIVLISSFVVCGAVLKHTCCHPGKPTLGQIQMQAFMAGQVNTAQMCGPCPLATVQQQPNSNLQNFGQPVPGYAPADAPPTYAAATTQYTQPFGMQDSLSKDVPSLSNDNEISDKGKF